MPNVMAALPNIGGSLCSTPQSLADARGLRGDAWTVTGQLADATGNFACLVFAFGGICETASCPIREMSSPRVGNPRVGVSASCPVTMGTTVIPRCTALLPR